MHIKLCGGPSRVSLLLGPLVSSPTGVFAYLLLLYLVSSPTQSVIVTRALLPAFVNCASIASVCVQTPRDLVSPLKAYRPSDPCRKGRRGTTLTLKALVESGPAIPPPQHPANPPLLPTALRSGSDIFSHLLHFSKRIFLWGPLTDEVAAALTAQLLLLCGETQERNKENKRRNRHDNLIKTISNDVEGKEEQDNTSVELVINCKGGSLTAGLALYDVLSLVSNTLSVRTLAVGAAGHMGALLLCAGKKGHRRVTKNARIFFCESTGKWTECVIIARCHSQVDSHPHYAASERVLVVGGVAVALLLLFGNSSTRRLIAPQSNAAFEVFSIYSNVHERTQVGNHWQKTATNNGRRIPDQRARGKSIFRLFFYCAAHAQGSANELLSQAASLASQERSMDKLLARHTKCPINEISKWRRQSKVFSAEEARAVGLVDTVIAEENNIERTSLH
ncbi:uncharacterized protein LOC113146684 [Cyclospora cayetanensis]|uniref:ATP-dependent Clp protease proteolytic subunit n=1 Tax=Cyclospora cayetanensis TaxID=88456 RepID=A0A6P6RRY8_9EIME|nr:uncharacterized protein LOC113146684 [Cyclospora cayetanensis]